MSHPSRLALDRHALGVGDEETKTHVAGCAECQAHLAKVQVELPVPAWVGAVDDRRPFPRWIFAVVAVGAVLGVLSWPSHKPEMTAKGAAPEVVVWLKHEESVTPWNGQTVHPKDSIRLEYAAGKFQQLTILDGTTVADRESIQAHGFTQSLVFDEAPGPEQLTVMLSATPLSDDEIRAALDGGTGAWTKSWTFPKETR